MSFAAYRAVTEARDKGRLPGGNALAVGLAVIHHTNQYGELRAGVRALADWADVSKSTAARHVAAFVSAGLYQIVVPGTSHRPARYRLTSHQGDVEPVDNVSTTSHQGDVIYVPRRTKYTRVYVPSGRRVLS